LITIEEGGDNGRNKLISITGRERKEEGVDEEEDALGDVVHRDVCFRNRIWDVFVVSVYVLSSTLKN
jgi:hypothetical protein